ncbi:MAG: hypothetical protein AAFW60_05280 [Pseudomonadota bacterium]
MMKAVKVVTTGSLFVGGYFAITALFGSETDPDPNKLARDAYVTECMEARTGWRRGTGGFYDSTTRDERSRMARLCGIDFDNERVDQAEQAVRDGHLEVRGQVDPRYHPQLADSE